jgi:hypothetical protein
VICRYHASGVPQTCNVNCLNCHQTYNGCATCQTLLLIAALFFPLVSVLFLKFFFQFVLDLENFVRAFVSHHKGIEFGKNLSQSFFIIALGIGRILEQQVFKVQFCEHGHFPSAMTIKDSKQIRPIAINIKLKYISILHGFTPPSHMTRSPNQFL